MCICDCFMTTLGETTEKFEKKNGEYLYNVYVILLDDAAGKTRNARKNNPNRDPRKDCVYVGATIYDPAKRFKQHMDGHWTSSRWVRRFGKRLMPEIYERFKPLPQSKAYILEKELAKELRNKGYTVFGGH